MYACGVWGEREVNKRADNSVNKASEFCPRLERERKLVEKARGLDLAGGDHVWCRGWPSTATHTHRQGNRTHNF